MTTAAMTATNSNSNPTFISNPNLNSNSKSRIIELQMTSDYRISCEVCKADIWSSERSSHLSHHPGSSGFDNTTRRFSSTKSPRQKTETVYGVIEPQAYNNPPPPPPPPPPSTSDDEVSKTINRTIKYACPECGFSDWRKSVILRKHARREHPEKTITKVKVKTMRVVIKPTVEVPDYECGALVLAKLKPYPWWPSVILREPRGNSYFVDGKYHVGFFDSKAMTRGWIPSENLVPYSMHSFCTMNEYFFRRKIPKYSKWITNAEKASDWAEYCRCWTNERRINEFGLEGPSRRKKRTEDKKDEIIVRNEAVEEEVVKAKEESNATLSSFNEVRKEEEAVIKTNAASNEDLKEAVIKTNAASNEDLKEAAFKTNTASNEDLSEADFNEVLSDFL